MKTPTQLAEAVIAKGTWREWDYDAIRNAIAEGIEADRAQRDEQIIAQKQWVLDDFKTYWEVNFDGEHELTDEQVEEVIESAPNYLAYSVLEDCSDEEWRAIEDALRDSLEEVTK